MSGWAVLEFPRVEEGYRCVARLQDHLCTALVHSLWISLLRKSPVHTKQKYKGLDRSKAVITWMFLFAYHVMLYLA